MRAFKFPFVVMLFSLLAACVTINVYFPAAQAEQAADLIIRDILGKPQADQPEAPQSSTPEKSGSIAPVRWVAQALTLMVPEAHAQADLNINTDAIRRLRADMMRRQQQLKSFFDRGVIGFSNNGLVAVRDAAAVPLRERNTLKQRMAAENRDRNALYAEIAKANGHPEWESNIRATFAQRWVANAAGGWWYQDARGQWRQK